MVSRPQGGDGHSGRIEGYGAEMLGLIAGKVDDMHGACFAPSTICRFRAPLLLAVRRQLRSARARRVTVFQRAFVKHLDCKPFIIALSYFGVLSCGWSVVCGGWFWDSLV